MKKNFGINSNIQIICFLDYKRLNRNNQKYNKTFKVAKLGHNAHAISVKNLKNFHLYRYT